jgi:uncharacterized membrane protein YdfJ with MMPL/SSD domain
VHHALLPLSLATGTTAVGLATLAVSELVPIRMFGIFSAIGVVVSFVILVTFMPAALELCPPKLRIGKLAEGGEQGAGWQPVESSRWWAAGEWITRHHALATAACLLLMAAVGYGMTRVESSVQLMRLFSRNAQIRTDYAWLEKHLGPLVPMEILVRIEKDCPLTFLERMELVGEIQQEIGVLDAVGSSLSTVTFGRSLDMGSGGDGVGGAAARAVGLGARTRRSVLNRRLVAHRDDFLAGDYLREASFTDADGNQRSQELWRISARVSAIQEVDYALFKADLQQKAVDDAKAKIASYRAEARAILNAPLTPQQQALIAQAKSLLAQAQSLATQRAALLRKRDALLRDEARLLAQVASLNYQKNQLLALQAEANQQLAEANALKAEVTAALTAAGGNPLGTDPRLVKLQNALKATKGVKGVSVPSVNKSGTAAYYNAIPTTAPASDVTVALVKRVRDSVVPKVEKETNGLTAYVGGTTAGNIDLAHEITDSLPLVIMTVALLNMLVLLLAFRSILIPIQAALVITLIALATFGLLTFVFQWGFGFSAVGLDAANVCCSIGGRPSDPIASYVPLMMYAAIFGLANDYQVFLLSRVGADGVKVSPAKAVADGVRTAGKVIATAALIMLSVFAAFIINGDPVIKQFGVGLSAGVLLAGGLTLFMVPAILRLMGRATHWIPKWLNKILPHVDIEGEKLLEKTAEADAPAKAPGA